jgi:hypothetical protein
MYSNWLNRRLRDGGSCLHLRQYIRTLRWSKCALLSTRAASTGRTIIVRGHSLIPVANVEEPEVDVTVLTTTTVGVLPGEAGSVVVLATIFAVVGAAGLLFSVAPPMPQYPLYSETPEDKSISSVLQCTLIHEVRYDETEPSKSVRHMQESIGLLLTWLREQGFTRPNSGVGLSCIKNPTCYVLFNFVLSRHKNGGLREMCSHTNSTHLGDHTL